MTDPLALQQTIVKQIVNLHLMQMITAIQLNMGVGTGDIAGIFFTEEKLRLLKEPLEQALTEYANLEILYSDSSGA